MWLLTSPHRRRHRNRTALGKEGQLKTWGGLACMGSKEQVPQGVWRPTTLPVSGHSLLHGGMPQPHSSAAALQASTPSLEECLLRFFACFLGFLLLFNAGILHILWLSMTSQLCTCFASASPILKLSVQFPDDMHIELALFHIYGISLIHTPHIFW